VNVFYLDTKPNVAAMYMCDKHVVKMTLESAQLLATAFHVLDMGSLPKKDGSPYLPTHINHPCNVWARHSIHNLAWLVCHARQLAIEYAKRYGKVHGSLGAIDKAYRMYSLYYGSPEAQWQQHELPPMCMPEQYKQSDRVEAYRDYYRKDKAGFAKWKLSQPYWWEMSNAD
jgi:hypothetical protein